MRSFIQAQQTTSRLWEYRYLNFHFVRDTQLVLDWLASLQDCPSIEMFHALWLPAIPIAKSRENIILALQNHYLITVRDEVMIEITDKGREYLKWRGGPLPYTSQAQRAPDASAANKHTYDTCRLPAGLDANRALGARAGPGPDHGNPPPRRPG